MQSLPLRIQRWTVYWLAGLSSALAAAPAAELSDADWLGQVHEQLAALEYQASYNAEGLQAPNRAQGIRTYFAADGIRVMERSSAQPQELLRLRLQSVDRADAPQALSAGALSHAGRRVEIRRPGIVEWYENRADGLEQGLILEQRPSGTGAVRVTIEIGGASAVLEGGASSSEVVLKTPTGRLLRYSKLKAWDAAGIALNAWMEASSDRIALFVDDANARYPLTIDPLISGTVDALLEINQQQAELGTSLDAAGDVNGDGHADLIVGAPFFDSGQADEGAAFVFQGSQLGLNSTAFDRLDVNQANARLGTRVAGAGDLNGDGYAEVLAWSPAFDSGSGPVSTLHLYYGSIFGPRSNDVQRFSGVGIGAGVGDVNGDGYADLLIGHRSYSNGQNEEGAVFLHLGGANGVSATPSITIESNQASSGFGANLAGAGDVNGDGFADVIVGAAVWDQGETNEGAAFIFHGGAGGISTQFDLLLQGNQEQAVFGSSVAGAGDVNGDGYADVIVGAPAYSNGQVREGVAFVYFGSSSGISVASQTLLEENSQAADFGRSVATAGDVNGDGYADLIVGQPLYDPLGVDGGAAYIYHGGPSGISTAFAHRLTSGQADARLGEVVSGAGDVNGDGYADVAAGARLYDAGSTDEGAVFFYLGGGASLRAIANRQLESNQTGAGFGYSLAAAGDINGDGYSDVIIGAPDFDGGQTDEGAAFIYRGSATGIGTTFSRRLEANQADAEFGFTVSGAGDVNNDGYADVIVGAPKFTNPQVNEGAAFVFHGSAVGVSSSFAVRLEANQANAQFGFSVAGAGDVDGDGNADVIVGAWLYDNGETNEGAAFVYHGGFSGIGPSFATQVESNANASLLGSSVAGAGDVNGDGYADVIIGAPSFDTGGGAAGAAVVHHGSSAGILSVAAIQLVSVQANANLGVSVAGAGDVNADGYADVIVGANLYDGGQVDEGAAFVYHGSANGIGSAVRTRVESDQAGAQLGISVAGAGDINGDGYADVVVGAFLYSLGSLAINNGAAFAYHGSVAGVGTSAASRVDIAQADARMGWSVAGAGDVNGDGFADVIVGARTFDGGQADEGAALIYQGNSDGRLVMPRQYSGDGVSPVQLSASSRHANAFVHKMQVSSPRGRELVKLEVQACPSGIAFGESQCIRRFSTDWTALPIGSSGLNLSSSVAGLSPATLYHWRARALYLPLTASVAGISPATVPVHGPWRRYFANASLEDIRPLGTLRVEPGTRDFGNRVVGGTAGPFAVTLTNTSGASISVNGLTGASSPFQRTGAGTCATNLPFSIAAGANCTLAYIFRPTAAGYVSQDFDLSFDANGVGGFVLAGTGQQAVVTLSPGSIQFADQPVNTTSNARSMLLTNTGNLPLNLTALGTPAAPFSFVSGGCESALPTTLAPGSSCLMQFRFTPTTRGDFSQSLMISGDGAGASTIELSGSGTQGDLAIVPQAIDFGEQVIGLASTEREVLLRNDGNQALQIVTLSSASAPFARSGNGSCSGSLPINIAAAGSCSLRFVFTPQSAGAHNQNLTVSVGSGAVGSGSIALSGIGVGRTLTITPRTVTFGPLMVGTFGPFREVNLRNDGTTGLTISGLTVATAPFQRIAGGSCSSSLPFSLNPASDCTIRYDFAPTQVGPAAQTIQVSDDAAGDDSYELTGTGTLGDAIFDDGYEVP